MDKIIIGQFVKPQGIHGELKAKSYIENIDCLQNGMILYSGSNYEALTLSNYALRQGFLYLKFNEIITINDAKRYLNKSICLDKNDLQDIKEDEFFIEDIIGFEIVLDDGTQLGLLDDVQNFGSADIFYIKDKNKKQILFPNVRDIIIKIDIPKKEIILDKKIFNEVSVL